MSEKCAGSRPDIHSFCKTPPLNKSCVHQVQGSDLLLLKSNKRPAEQEDGDQFRTANLRRCCNSCSLMLWAFSTDRYTLDASKLSQRLITPVITGVAKGGTRGPCHPPPVDRRVKKKEKLGREKGGGVKGKEEKRKNKKRKNKQKKFP